MKPTLRRSWSPTTTRPWSRPARWWRRWRSARCLLTTSGKGSEETARRVAKVIPVLFGALSGLALSDRHPKWREVNLAATLPGWSRFAAAEEWLAKAREQQAGSLQKRFEDFLRATRQPGATDLPAAEQKKLFDEFVGWTRKSLGDAGQSVRQ